MDFKNKIIVIAGPTASGKSELANILAKQLNGEVVSADSMQIYRGMDIGTGKFLPEEQSVKHWGIDIINPDQAYSAALFQKYARNCFTNINARNKKIILCGGTGFYIRAAIDDYNFPKGEQVNNNLRNHYKKIAEENGSKYLWDILYQKDENSAKIIHQNNTTRIIRALELLDNGTTYWHQKNNLANLKSKYNTIFFGLKVDRDVLNQRINKRVDKMIKDGLIDEVQNLYKVGYKDYLTSSSAIGYKEIVSYLDKKITLDEAINNIKQSSRQYAKRQRTWFRKDKRIIWIDYNDCNTDKTIKYIIKIYNNEKVNN